MSLKYQLLADANQDSEQRGKIINALETEIQHFSKAMQAIEKLPSSTDKQMTDAYTAYCKMIDAYQEMISVRMSIIRRLKAS
ncbi:hypothetical protein [Litoribacillus peritrichatus]|uniref:Uncharacterized protein n=1 Tax=Litoribacillus peritrichatus TaxID=718191 RepID=A0ABP7N555_9GAMM